MDLKIKKLYIDQEDGGSPVERKVIIDSKFRRETSNFKVNFDISSLKPTSEDPVLIKYIEKNLKPEELLGLVVYIPVSVPNHPTIGHAYTIISASARTDGLDSDFVYYELSTWSEDTTLYYVPSTGALSMVGPYVEEEEGGETTGKMIDLTKLTSARETIGTDTYNVLSGYETGLTPPDFTGATFVVLDQAGKIITRVASVGYTGDSLASAGYTVFIRTRDLYTIYYNQTTGQFAVAVKLSQ